MRNYSTRIDSQELFIFLLVIIYICVLSFQKPGINSELYFPRVCFQHGAYRWTKSVSQTFLAPCRKNIFGLVQWCSPVPFVAALLLLVLLFQYSSHFGNVAGILGTNVFPVLQQIAISTIFLSWLRRDIGPRFVGSSVLSFMCIITASSFWQFIGASPLLPHAFHSSMTISALRLTSM